MNTLLQIGVDCFWSPLVIGPQGIPIVNNLEEAERWPELAVLSVMAHGRDSVPVAVSIASAAAHSIEQLPEDVRLLYSALIESALSDAARKAFQMLHQTQKFFSESQRRSYLEGRAEGEAKALLLVLAGRGLSVSAEERERILACKDESVLASWLKRAGSVTATAELFG